KTMLEIMLTAFMLPLLLLFGPSEVGLGNSVSQSKKKNPDSQSGGSGTLKKMIVETGSVTMDVDLNRLNGIRSTTGKPETMHFAVAANSFFPILVFNNLLRGPQPGSMELVPQNSATFPALLNASLNQLVVEKLAAGEPFDLAVRDAKTGFVFFNIEGHQYSYDAKGQLLSIQRGRVLISKEFANALGRPTDAGAVVGRISIGAVMQPIETRR